MLTSTVCWYFYVPFRQYALSLNVLLFFNTFLVFLLCQHNYLYRKCAKKYWKKSTKHNET